MQGSELGWHAETLVRDENTQAFLRPPIWKRKWAVSASNCIFNPKATLKNRQGILASHNNKMHLFSNAASSNRHQAGQAVRPICSRSPHNHILFHPPPRTPPDHLPSPAKKTLRCCRSAHHMDPPLNATHVQLRLEIRKSTKPKKNTQPPGYQKNMY